MIGFIPSTERTGRFPTVGRPWLLALLILCGGTGSARALDVDRVLWGFDGRVQVGRFNPVSILVSNPTPTPFDGTFRLRRSTGAGSRVGAVIVRPVFVSPFSSRWMQLYPYIIDENDQWRLRWDGGQEIVLSRPRVVKKPLPILLVAEDDATGRGALKRFPENLFPASVTGTGTLTIAVLDHAPRWTATRSRAFLDWLSGGGTLHLFQDRDGSRPVFSAGLDALNTPTARFAVGAGTVIRHAVPLGSADKTLIQTKLLGAGESITPPSALKSDTKQADKTTNTDMTGWQNSADSLYGNPTPSLFSALRVMTRARHPWVAIYLLSFVYLGLMFPGFLILGRSRLDLRWAYTAFLGVIGLFSLVFLIVGRHGVGEQTAVHSVMIARVLPDGSYDVTEWASVFAQSGATFSIEHAGTGRLYSTAQDNEPVPGTIQNGPDGRLTVDIPPYSWRPFLARRKVTANPWTISVAQWQAGAGLDRLSLIAGKRFPAAEQILDVKVLYRNRLYSMRVAKERLELSDAGSPLADYFNNHDLDTDVLDSVPVADVDHADDADHRLVTRAFRMLLAPLIAGNLELTTEKQAEQFALPDDRLRLFVYAETPVELKLQSGALKNHSGYVLYSIDLLEPARP